MASETQLCNMALTKIGYLTEIIDRSEDTQAARKCDLLFDDIRREVIMEGNFTSTYKRAELGRLAAAPEFEWTYQFQLPADFLRLISVNEAAPGSIPHAIEGSVLVTDSSTIKIRYVADITDTTKWDEMLKKAFVYRLASELAYAITGDKQMAIELNQLYFAVRKDAMAVQGAQGSTLVARSDDLLDVR